MPSAHHPRPPALFTRARALTIAACALAVILAAPSGSSDSVAAKGQRVLDPGSSRGSVEFLFKVRRAHDFDSWGSEAVPLSRLEGLKLTDLAAASADVRFELRRDAGTFTCEGRVANGRGAGVFELRLDPHFAAELSRRGVGTPSEAEQVKLTFSDAGYALLDELHAQSFPTPRVGQLVVVAEHGVDLEFVRGLATLGYRLASVSELVEARDHGVDPDFIRGLNEAGIERLPIEALITARDHGVDPAYIGALRTLGHSGLPMDELVELRDHGVDAAYIGAMSRSGYASASLRQLERCRDHGVDPRFIADLESAGYKDLGLDQLIRARDHVVDGRFARRVRAKAGSSPPIERLIEIRDRGETDD